MTMYYDKFVVVPGTFHFPFFTGHITIYHYISLWVSPLKVPVAKTNPSTIHATLVQRNAKALRGRNVQVSKFLVRALIRVGAVPRPMFRFLVPEIGLLPQHFR